MSAGRILGGLLAGAAVAVLAVVLLGSGGNAYIVKAEFKDAGGVRKNSDVKIGEVPAGRVVGVDLSKTDTALVTMKLDHGVGPVGVGATASSRPVNLLGEKYVDLSLGDDRRPVPSGSTIPAARTKTAVELDEIINTLQPGTRARLRILINEAGIAMAGQGADFNGMLAQMPPGLDQAATFLGALSSDTHKLAGLVEQGDRVIAAVSARRRRLSALVDSAGSALRTVADRRAALGRTLEAAPAGLTQLRLTLDELRRAGDDLRPAAANLRSTSGPLASTLQQLPGVARDARGTLAEATRVAPGLTRLGVQATPTVKRLRPTLRHLADVTTDLEPLTDGLAHGGVLQLVRFANNWSGLTSLTDGISHVFRVRLLAGPDALTSQGSPKTPQIRSRRPAERPVATPAATAPSSPPPAGRPAPKVPLPTAVTKVLQGVNAATSDVLKADPAAAVGNVLKSLGAPPPGPPRGGTGGPTRILDVLLGN
jgi:phospholipid/cholesterol/gamma-HCH transport system substrate-binding protein